MIFSFEAGIIQSGLVKSDIHRHHSEGHSEGLSARITVARAIHLSSQLQPPAHKFVVANILLNELKRDSVTQGLRIEQSFGT